ncbi:bifunctional phosphopantothenoylcysteine decarboxylase/phosphopantothenate--cysteine ligase CoaBC [Microbacterium schleiferi]|uniref:Coenzyme A biosynthesis bifunctional protein CoaBC n=1 Tax=Microbacterium schleiferi TaxID=69362 RepID=A0A7S8MXC8_9MICO|nr:bifunctional phosphopantothenoylcysteine decarboxylase/phosphopantothenate--cysteine ligase CoaBC [Microbacterium schleiferi]QPE04984.1 bifunctional phosphopantothenoylcysteine decarboxylase/phosphopantothenate--cysteine ligase CoaBC [Microbacterium schleiferi]
MFVVVGVTGGIAAYKTVHLVRRLIGEGHEVHVVPTSDALRFVGQPTWEAISRNPVTTSVHEDVATVRHVSLGQRADLVIVAPATANTLAKMAAGLADDLLGTTLLATTAPVVVAPAMHTEMWRHPATQENMRVLRSRGVHVVGPANGPLTGGDSGPGRMSEPDEIADVALAVVAAAGPGRAQDLAGLRVVVSAGGTREPLDPVRFLGNRSSGRQGVALAVAAADRGAEVTLVAAHIDGEVIGEVLGGVRGRVTVVSVGTALEMQDAVTDAASGADVVVMAAAVADYRPAEVAESKLTKEAQGDRLTLELVENPDIVAGLAAARRPGQTVVAFAAETSSGDELLERARRKRERKDVDLLVVNEVGWTRGFETADNEIVVIGRAGGVAAQTSGSKREVADAVWDAVVATRR